MAEQKIDPNRPKDDQAPAGTSFQPTATPPVTKDGAVLPLGPQTLEAQREAFKQAEQGSTTQTQDNPLQVAGVEADIQNAAQNPTQSGPASYTKDDVKKQGQTTKQGLEEQTNEVKAEQVSEQQQNTKVARPASDNLPSGDVSKAGAGQNNVKATQTSPPKPGEVAPKPKSTRKK